MRVLHVVESFGGGVATTLPHYVSNTPQYEHHLLYSIRDGDYVSDGELQCFASAVQLAPNGIKALRSIRSSVARLNPTIIHAHSSFAGAYARLSVKSGKRRKIVYTPHGFSFERRDIAKIERLLFYLAEKLLVPNTSVIAGCSPREVKLATKLGARTVYVPNIARPRPGQCSNQLKKENGQVVVLGRIAPQRDPQWVVRVVKAVKILDPSMTFVWIGDGDRKERSRLESAGVHVTGWLPHSEAVSLMEGANMMLHSALWDGFPMSILEAVAAEIPVLVRQIPAFEDVPKNLVVSDERDAAKRLVTLSRAGSPDPAGNLATWKTHLSENTSSYQGLRLADAYNAYGPMAKGALAKRS